MAITVTSEQKCNELPEVTNPDSSYSFVAFDDGSNAGVKINYSKLADAILAKITETFPLAHTVSYGIIRFLSRI